MRRIVPILVAGVFLAPAVSAETRAAAIAKEPKAVLAPVPGGMSDRLAGLGKSLAGDKEAIRRELGSKLETSRQEAHDLIDQLVDSEHYESWIGAMEEKDGTGLAREISGKPKEQVRAALHSRLDRRLSDLGREISDKIGKESPDRIRASFKLALTDLAREETDVVVSARASLGDAAGPTPDGAPEAGDAPSAPGAAGPSAPYYPAYAQYQMGGVRAYNAQAWANPAYQRTMDIVQQRAYYQGQLAAAQWNARVSSFNQYLYGRSQPAYSNPAYRYYYQSRFPAGYYYRPDRVEQVVRRGLWGAAAVAATPFALVASLF